jgi:hypothetical protein
MQETEVTNANNLYYNLLSFCWYKLENEITPNVQGLASTSTQVSNTTEKPSSKISIHILLSLKFLIIYLQSSCELLNLQKLQPT